MRLWPIGRVGSGRKAVYVGWFLQTSDAKFIWKAPARIQSPRAKHVKSAARCPAIVDQEHRLFELTCPFDLQLRVRRGNDGASLSVVNQEQCSLVPEALKKTVFLMPEYQWRHPDRPIVQVRTPYTFVSDATAYVSQLPPFLAYRSEPWPGLVIGGRIPAHVWPRPLAWAFEWHDTTRDLVLKSGEPWFYCQIETSDPTGRVRLVEATMTPELKEYCSGINGVTNYVSQTFALFRTARERRPRRLLVPAR